MHAKGAERAVVIDGSAAINAVLVADAFDGWSHIRLLAPTLLWSEAAAGLSQMGWRGDLGASEVDSALNRLIAAPIETTLSRELVAEAAVIARRLGWAKTYDAEYVALARRLAIPLLSVDARLRAGAKALVEVVSPLDVESWNR